MKKKLNLKLKERKINKLLAILIKNWNIVIVIIALFICFSILNGIVYGIIATILMTAFYYFLYKF